METNRVEVELFDDSRTFLHPVRCRILELLAEKLMNLNAISLALNMERRLVAHHLFTLEDCGYVKSRYAILQPDESKGMLLRVYTVTDKVAEVRAKLRKVPKTGIPTGDVAEELQAKTKVAMGEESLSQV